MRTSIPESPTTQARLLSALHCMATGKRLVATRTIGGKILRTDDGREVVMGATLGAGKPYTVVEEHDGTVTVIDETGSPGVYRRSFFQEPDEASSEDPG